MIIVSMKLRWISLAAMLTSTAHAGEMRIWTNTNGRLVEAEMTGVNTARRAVHVRLKDGSEAEILIENLSPPDKDYAKTQWAAMQGVPAGTPALNTTNMAAPPARYASRFGADTRLKKIVEGGGRTDIEAAVIRSLNLFKTSQSPDGSWGRSNKGAMTGFALQCFFGHGETADSSEYGESVMKGLLYLISLAQKNPHGMLSENWEGGKGGSGCYEHAIATTALCEAYNIARLGTKILPGLRDCMEEAVKLVIEQQNKRGSWTYGGSGSLVYRADGSGADLSLANWHFLALEAAKHSAIKFDGLDGCISKAVSYIESTQTKDGGFGGASRDNHYNQWSLSGGAVAGLCLLQAPNTATSKKAVAFLTGFLAAEPPDWSKNCNLYCWHGYTHALFLHGGPEWQNYAKLVMPQIIAAQEPDGSFKRGRPNWPAADAADATYRQALCTLILETFYRCAR